MIHLAKLNKIGYQKKNLNYTFSHWSDDRFRFMGHTRNLNYPIIGPTMLVEWME